MNKPLLNKVLIVALIIIWALIGYKFLYGFSFKPEASFSETHIIPSKLVSKKIPDFKLKLVDRDPFLGTYSSPKTLQVTPIKKTITNNQKRDIRFIWPQIKYFGFIQNEASTHPLVMISVNNELIKVRKGNDYEGLIIQEVFRDSIIVKKGSQSKVVLKNK